MPLQTKTFTASHRQFGERGDLMVLESVNNQASAFVAELPPSSTATIHPATFQAVPFEVVVNRTPQTEWYYRATQTVVWEDGDGALVLAAVPSAVAAAEG
jgi:hypothetical protein